MNTFYTRLASLIIGSVCVLVPSFAFASFDTNLGYGASGSAVIALQQFLVQQDLIPSHAVTGNFLSLTQTGVQRFQTQQGISPASGFFGPLTRARANAVVSGSGSVPITDPNNINTGSITAQIAQLQEQIRQLEAQLSSLGTPNSQCVSVPQPLTTCLGTWRAATVTNGCTLAWQCVVGSTAAPSISSISSPTQLLIGQVGTWTVNVNTTSDNLSYAVRWGDEAMYPNASAATSGAVHSAATFTHAYSTAGTYMPLFTVTNTSGQSATVSATVVVTGSSINATFNVGPTSGNAPLTVNFSGTAPIGYSIDYGDGTPVPAVGCGGTSCGSSSVPITGSHTYTAVGTYIAKLIAGGTTLGTATITVLNTTPSPAMKLSTNLSGTATPQTPLPKAMSFLASYPISSMVNPNDPATYTVNYGDGTSATMTYQNVGCPVDGGGSCMATWTAPNHTFTVPGEYTAILYRNGTQIDSTSFLVFTADVQTSVAGGPATLGSILGATPLSITFTFTGGTSVDFGDGTAAQNLCSTNCAQWSTTQHAVQHTYTSPGFHQMKITFNGLPMEGVDVSALNGTVTSITPTSGPVGTAVTMYGSGFTSAGAADFLSLCNAGNTNCGNFTLKNFTIAPDDSSITFTIPPTYTVTTVMCTSGGGGCTSGTSQTKPVLPATYSVGFDGTGFAAGLPLTFTITP